MRERIGEAIAKEIDKHPESENMRRQLSLLARANIMTIHSFCKTLFQNIYRKLILIRISEWQMRQKVHLCV